MEFVLGEIRKGKDIGRRGSNKWIWHACIKCGKQRWVLLLRGQPGNLPCRSCASKLFWQNPEYSKKHKGPLHHCWKGGRMKATQGYTLVKVYPDNPLFAMANSHGYIPEHRLVMAQHLNRPLLRNEQVHHRDGIKNHNDDQNLLLISLANHNLYTKFCKDCRLRREIKLLKLRINWLEEQLQGHLGTSGG